jgi:hypothetical protein
VAVVEDRRHDAGVAIGGVARDDEGRVHPALAQQGQDARDAADDAEAALGQRRQAAGVLGAVAEEAGLGVDVEGEGDRAARALRPVPALAHA